MIENFIDLIQSNPVGTMFIIINIVVLECLLSIDNAAVLATMVLDLPEKQRKKALKYGILGAYIFRGLALVFASSLVKIWWLKPIGGLYLLWMAFTYFKNKNKQIEVINTPKKGNWFSKNMLRLLGTFWSTVVMIEIMDIAFSIDNIFAVVAFSKNYIIICFGVFIGILAMRFIAQKFVILMEKFPFLNDCAFIVLIILGLKLCFSIIVRLIPSLNWIEGESFDWIISGITLSIFILPILYYKIFNLKK